TIETITPKIIVSKKFPLTFRTNNTNPINKVNSIVNGTGWKILFKATIVPGAETMISLFFNPRKIKKNPTPALIPLIMVPGIANSNLPVILKYVNKKNNIPTIKTIDKLSCHVKANAPTKMYVKKALSLIPGAKINGDLAYNPINMLLKAVVKIVAIITEL